jgi:hypothetical protein
MRHIVVVCVAELVRAVRNVYGAFVNAPDICGPGVYKGAGSGGRDKVVIPDAWAKFLVEELFCRKRTKNSLLFDMPSTIPDVCFQIESETYRFEVCQGTGAESSCLHIEGILVTPSTSQLTIRLTKANWRASGLGRWVTQDRKKDRSPVVAAVLKQWNSGAADPLPLTRKRFFPFGTDGMATARQVRRSLKRKRPIHIRNLAAIDEAKEVRMHLGKFVDAFRPSVSLIPPGGSSWWDEDARRILVLGCGGSGSEWEREKGGLLKYVHKRLRPTEIMHYDGLPLPTLDAEDSRVRVMTLGSVPARAERQLLRAMVSPSSYA